MLKLLNKRRQAKRKITSSKLVLDRMSKNKLSYYVYIEIFIFLRNLKHIRNKKESRETFGRLQKRTNEIIG